MALLKEIELDSGIVLTYHRIKSINKITNSSNIIEVCSYINETQRNKEQTYLDIQKKKVNSEELTPEEQEIVNKSSNVYTKTNFISVSYDPNQTIDDIYNYLKTLDEYKDAEDV